MSQDDWEDQAYNDYLGNGENSDFNEFANAVEAAKKDLLDWQNIHDWAEQKQPGEKLGQSCTNSSCPLASYLNEETGGRWSVGPSIKDEHGNRLVKPGWIKMLIELTDGSTAHNSDDVTREMFLEVLEKIKPEGEAH